MNGTFYLSTSHENYWDVQNFLYADRTYLGGKNTIVPTETKGLMMITFETQSMVHPLNLPVGSWSAGDTNRNV